MSRIDDLIRDLCPNGVTFVEIQELFTLRNGYTPSKSNASFWEGGTVPWFRMEDIRAYGGLLDSALQQVPEAAVKGGRVFPANSLLVATSATIGQHALVTVPHLSNQRFTSLSLKDEYAGRLEMKFAYYYAFILDEWCKNNATTSSFASVEMAGFKKFKFPVPPLPVQQEIVRILDEFSQLEAELEAELETRRQQYAIYRGELLNLKSQDAQQLTMEDICTQVISGGTPLANREDYYGGEIPWLRTQEVHYADIHETDLKISDEGLANSSARWVPENSVIIAISGAGVTRGRAAVNKIPLTTNQHCCSLVIDPKKAHYRFVYHYVRDQYDALRQMGRGNRSDLTLGIIRKFPITLPSLADQERVAGILDKFDMLANDLSIGLPAELAARRKQYEYYRDKLLTFKELER